MAKNSCSGLLMWATIRGSVHPETNLLALVQTSIPGLACRVHPTTEQWARPGGCHRFATFERRFLMSKGKGARECLSIPVTEQVASNGACSLR